ncbi:uncharacterized protein LOC130999263 [Salvia miltiorrhiza]|uniref:uncharacterized protein LOC130999263 n=1 Tax=Salvia miltiorrhiza TaxID=226208 RepID=UPI0025AB91AD|nr:uncharacterized protein LOC130999263 [Salvia miltiorrhiza]
MISLLQCHSPTIFNLSSSFSSPRIPPIYCSKLSSLLKNSPKIRSQTTLRRSEFGDGVDPVQEPSFFDENGVVQDMDGYLNYLSLEYESVWDTKPSWCQPWTILLTGTGIITGSWLILNSIVVTSIAAILICLWWYIFLYSYPKAYSDMITERRNKVTSGQEDTYGMQTGRQS